MFKITHPITEAELEVANQDFPDEMTWTEAIRACSELGSGWRLPTKEELQEMYEKLHEKGQGNFKDVYWSSTADSSGYAWAFNFYDDSYLYCPYKDGSYYVRAIRAF